MKTTNTKQLKRIAQLAHQLLLTTDFQVEDTSHLDEFTIEASYELEKELRKAGFDQTRVLPGEK